jgi:hypothetical protein
MIILTRTKNSYNKIINALYIKTCIHEVSLMRTTILFLYHCSEAKKRLCLKIAAAYGFLLSLSGYLPRAL